jgi:hypothetical protein
VRKKCEHRPHAKRPQRAPLQSYVEANRKTLQSARRPWLGRLPDAWCWRRRSVRTGQWQLPSRRANQGSYGCCPLHQCVGKESSRHSLNLDAVMGLCSRGRGDGLNGAAEEGLKDVMKPSIAAGDTLLREQSRDA